MKKNQKFLILMTVFFVQIFIPYASVAQEKTDIPRPERTDLPPVDAPPHVSRIEPMPFMIAPRWINNDWNTQAPKPDQNWWRNKGQKLIRRDQFIQDLIGMTEKDFRNSKELMRDQDKPWSQKNEFDVSKLPNWVKGYPRRIATVAEPRFEQLDVMRLQFSRAQKEQGSFKILVWDPYYPWETDIRYLQAHPSNKEALFQVPSTFFGPLPHGMAQQTAYLDSMINNPGPAQEAAIATAGSTFRLKYFTSEPRYLLSKAIDFADVKLPDGKTIISKPNTFSELSLPEGIPSAPYNWIIAPKDPRSFIGNIELAFMPALVTSGYGDLTKTGQQQQLPINIDIGKENPLEHTQGVYLILGGTIDLDTINARIEKTSNNNKAKENAMRTALAICGSNYLAALASALEFKTTNVWLSNAQDGASQHLVGWLLNSFATEEVQPLANLGLHTKFVYRPQNQTPGSTRSAQTDRELFFGFKIAIPEEGNQPPERDLPPGPEMGQPTSQPQPKPQYVPGLLEVIDAVNSTTFADDQRLKSYIDEYLTLAYQYMAGNKSQEQRIHELATEINRSLMGLQSAREIVRPAPAVAKPAPKPAPKKVAKPARKKGPTKAKKKKIAKPKPAAAKAKAARRKARKPQRLKRRKVTRKKKTKKGKKRPTKKGARKTIGKK